MVTDVQSIRLASQEVINIGPGFKVETGGYFEANIHTIANDCDIEFFFGVDGEPQGFADTTGGSNSKKTKKSLTVLDAMVYPNPSKENINIEIKNAEGPFFYEIKNLNGRTLFEDRSSDSEFSIDVSRMESGFYILMLSNGKQMVTKKIVKI